MSIKESTITVNNMPVKIIRKNIKNLHLAVCPPDGWVRVSAPERVDDDTVRLAVMSRFGWIQRAVKKFQTQEHQTKRQMIRGETHYYQGHAYVLDVCHTHGKNRVEIKNNQTLTLHVKPNTSTENRKKLLESWYRNQMKSILPDAITKWEQRMGVKVNEWGIKRMKTRWGTCNPAHKRIWLNLELIKKPNVCLEYVLVHELVHFWERGHNSVFKSHMDRLMPNWRSIRDELNSAPLASEVW